MEKFQKKSCKERMIEIVTLMGIPKSQFYQNADLSNGSLDKLESELSLTSLMKIIEAYPQINTNYIISGKGEPFIQDCQPVIGNNNQLKITGKNAIGNNIKYESSDLSIGKIINILNIKYESSDLSIGKIINILNRIDKHLVDCADKLKNIEKQLEDKEAQTKKLLSNFEKGGN